MDAWKLEPVREMPGLTCINYGHGLRAYRGIASQRDHRSPYKGGEQGGVAGAVAGRALVVAKAHFAKEEEFVFPPAFSTRSRGPLGHRDIGYRKAAWQPIPCRRPRSQSFVVPSKLRPSRPPASAPSRSQTRLCGPGSWEGSSPSSAQACCTMRGSRAWCVPGNGICAFRPSRRTLSTW